MKIEKLVRFADPLLYHSSDKRFLVLPAAPGYTISDSRTGRSQRVRTLLEARIVIAATRAFDLRFTKGA